MQDILDKLEALKQSLTIPAAEYVPAIPEAWGQIDDIKALVTAPASGGREPTAWRCVNKNTGTVQLRDTPLDDLPFNRERWTCVPLYASPASPEIEGLREAVDLLQKWPLTHHGAATTEEVERGIILLAANDAVLAYRVQGFIHQALAASIAPAPEDQSQKDAARYRYLRDRDPGPIEGPTPAGLFIGRVPENVILTEAEADRAIDAALSASPVRGEG